jgi:biotin carboxyl carrier protein
MADAFTPNLPALVNVRLTRGAVTHSVQLHYERSRAVRASVDGAAPLALAEVSVTAHGVAACLGERRLQARCWHGQGRVHLWLGEAHEELLLDDPRAREFTASAASGGLTTPLPGVVVSVPVQVGQAVAAGAVLMVIEAMKMEHAITAPYAGSVTAIHFAQGERVPEGSELLELKRSS